jgi:7tm Odorant receptor
MDISEKLRKVIAKFRISLYAIGVEFTDPNYQYNLRTLTVIVCISVYLICTTYTFVAFDTDTKWRALGSVGMAAQGIMKYQIALRYCKEGFIEIQKIKEMYSQVQGERQSIEECKVLSNCMDACDKLLNVYMLMFAGGFLMFLAYPIAMYLVFDQKVLMITMAIPGIEPFGQFGFVIHTVCHTIMAFIVCAGTPAGDFYFMFCVAHIYAFVEFLRLRIERLNDCVVNPIRDGDWHRKVAEQLNEILVEHQNLLEFMERLDGYYFVTIAVHIGTATISMGIGLYLIVSVSIAQW